MAKSETLNPASVISQNGRFLIAITFAVIVHAIILAINFTAPQTAPKQRDIEIILVNPKKQTPPKKARILAQEHQIGSGQKFVRPSPPKLPVQNQGQTEKKAIAKTAEPTIKPHPIAKPEPSAKPQASPKMLSQKMAEKSLPLPVEKEIAHEKTHTQPEASQPLSAETLRMQIADLGSSIAKQESAGEEATRIKYLSSVSAYKYVAAQYMSDVRHKIERVGNRNFPDEAMKNITMANGILDIGIKEDGRIHSIRIKKSSGYPAVDNAAKKIVMMSAPFPPLPKALLSQLNVLMSHQPFSFSVESGMSTN